MPSALRALFLCLSALLAPLFTAPDARAQEQVWLQIEAQPTLEQATERARAYSSVFPETAGFRMRSGWYAVALGPYSVGEGAARLTALKRENLIPGDSYISDGSDYVQQYWPAGGATPAPAPEATVQPEVAVTTPEPQPEPLPEPLPVEEPDETAQQARASEAELSEEDRKLLQEALQWFGFYTGGIDGAFGRGTRTSMAAWQESMGLEPTGILTTANAPRCWAAIRPKWPPTALPR